jgi:hypothetical protein
MSVILFSTAIGPVPIDCVISERPTAELEITEIPIETGAKITDHAVVMPKRVTLDIANEAAAASYNALVAFQESRVPFTLVTGLAVFPNMLVKRIDAERDAMFSKVLRARVDLQEIIIVGTAYAADPEGDTDSGERGKAGGQKSTRAAPPTSGKAGDAATANRASQTVQRGDSAFSSAGPRDQSVLSSMFGSTPSPVTMPSGPQ